MNKYLDLVATSIEEYVDLINKGHDVTCVAFVDEIKKDLFSYLHQNHNATYRLQLAYIYLVYNYCLEDYTKHTFELLSSFDDSLDPIVPFLKYKYSKGGYNFNHNMDYYYNLSREVGPHFYDFSDDNDIERIIYFKDSYKIHCRSVFERTTNYNYKEALRYAKIGYEMGSKSCAIDITYLCSSFSYDLYDLELAFEAFKFHAKDLHKEQYSYTLNKTFWQNDPCWNIIMSFYHNGDYRLYEMYQLMSYKYLNHPINDFALALCYLKGLGTPLNYKAAFDIFSKYENDEDSNLEYSNFFLAMMYKDGLYVKKDLNKAIEHFLKGKINYGEPNYEIGMIYYNQDNITQAIKYLEEAANYGINSNVFNYGRNEACKFLGWIYYHGLKVEKNFEKAAEFYSITIKDGGAMNNAGIIYQHSLKNDKMAFNCYEASYKLKDPAGTFNYAKCFFFGTGCEINYELFNKYGKEAKELGCQEAIDYFK